MSINIRHIDPFVVPSTLDEAYRKAVGAGIGYFSAEKSAYLFEEKSHLYVALMDGGVSSISSLKKREGGGNFFGKLSHLMHCAIIVNHSVSAQL